MRRPPERLYFDASPLLHSAAAGELEQLGRLVTAAECGTTPAVLDEIRRNNGDAYDTVLKADWLRPLATDSLEFMAAFASWTERMGVKGGHDIGETTLCAYAELHGGTLVIDDKEARRVAAAHGLGVRGTLGLVADACAQGVIAPAEATAFVERLRDAGMRLPFPPGGLLDWCRRLGLLN